MLSFIKKMFQPSPSAGDGIALQPPGVPFPWPRGAQLTALESVTIAIPAAALAADEKIGSLINGVQILKFDYRPSPAIP